MTEFENIKITVENNGEKLVIEADWDADIWAWANHFRTILLWLTFAPRSIERVIAQEDDESGEDYSPEDQEID